MRKILILLFVILLLSACSKKAVNEDQMMSDIKASFDEYLWDQTNITDLTVIKRQTNQTDKTDYVWVCVSGDNEDYYVVRNYQLRYVLYNDGWMIEDISTYYNEDNPDYMIAKQGVTMERVQDDYGYIGEIPSWSPLFDCSSFGDVYSFSAGILDIAHSDAAYIDEYGGRDSWCFNCVYHYDFFDEYVEVPIVYYFNTYYGVWEPYVDYQGITRTAKMNTGLVGVWEGAQIIENTNYTWNHNKLTEAGTETLYDKHVVFEVISVDDTGITVGNYQFIDNLLGETTTDGGGHIAVQFKIVESGDYQGKLTLSLAWDDGLNHALATNNLPNVWFPTQSLPFFHFTDRIEDGQGSVHIELKKTS